MAAAEVRQGTAVTLILGGIYTALGSLLIPAWQGYMWLRYGAWPEVPLWIVWNWSGLPFPQINWVGIEKILVWVLGQPTSVVSFLIGIILAGIGSALPK